MKHELACKSAAKFESPLVADKRRYFRPNGQVALSARSF